MLHVNSDIVSRIISDIDAECGDTDKMNITPRKIHMYIGMTIDYYSPGKVKFSLVDYIGKIIDDIL